MRARFGVEEIPVTPQGTKNIIIDILKISYELNDEAIEEYIEYLNIKDYILSPAEVQSICFKNNNIKDCINEIVMTAQKHI